MRSKFPSVCLGLIALIACMYRLPGIQFYVISSFDKGLSPEDAFFGYCTLDLAWEKQSSGDMEHLCSNAGSRCISGLTSWPAF